jgi:hypothetical protein
MAEPARYGPGGSTGDHPEVTPRGLQGILALEMVMSAVWSSNPGRNWPDSPIRGDAAICQRMTAFIGGRESRL